jgi:nitrite reductase (NADH) small subunit
MTRKRDWIDIAPLDAVPRSGARCINTPDGRIAIFRTADDRVFATEDRCPHAGGPLSQGIVHGGAVTCPLHNWVIDLESGGVVGPDEGAVKTIPVRVEKGCILMCLALRAEAAA